MSIQRSVLVLACGGGLIFDRFWAVDSDGDINGALRANGTLEMIYQEPGTSDAAAAVVHLRRSG